MALAEQLANHVILSACTQQGCSRCHSTCSWCSCLSMLVPLHAPSSHVRDHDNPALVFLLVACPVDACKQSVLSRHQGLQLQVAHAQICKLSKRFIDIVPALLQHPLQVMSQLR